MTFTQLTTRLKNFLSGWLLFLGLKECLVECATVFVKSVVILSRYPQHQNQPFSMKSHLKSGSCILFCPFFNTIFFLIYGIWHLIFSSSSLFFKYCKSCLHVWLYYMLMFAIMYSDKLEKILKVA